ncbi:MAG TPA: lamin tail domain-containing protein [Fibrobacteria bacterium]|nr:lamin tail domain-containing protein [Fibrobacteria bacterium]HOX50275.1 lamin tail domain-containing protein [Fibrobacteria bacterium]
MTMFPFPAILALVAAVRLSEIQANPQEGLPEFVELSGTPGRCLAGWSLSDATRRRVFPDSSAIAASGLLVVSPDCRSLREAWAGADIPCVQPSSWGRLSAGSDLLVLRDSLGTVTDSVHWSEKNWGAWPRGKSRVRTSPDAPGSDPLSWRISRAELGASPGWIEAFPEETGSSFALEIPRRTMHPGTPFAMVVRSEAPVRLELFDLARRPAGIVFDGTPPVDGRIVWDGKVAGRNPTPGVYLLLARCGGGIRREWIAVGKP